MIARKLVPWANCISPSPLKSPKDPARISSLLVLGHSSRDEDVELVIIWRWLRKRRPLLPTPLWASIQIRQGTSGFLCPEVEETSKSTCAAARQVVLMGILCQTSISSKVGEEIFIFLKGIYPNCLLRLILLARLSYDLPFSGSSSRSFFVDLER